ncbi:MAG TPA: carbohydrate binding domain-containing protein [Candidatus Acidoferrum sp.]|nr:carbohydrate binding domain-containing protein [Candidatus Acidoferrum sp.]
MILRLSSPAVRGLFVFLALVFVAGLSYSGIRNALAVHEAGLNTPEGYKRATQIEPDDARNWYLLGRYWQYNLEHPVAPAAISAYQKALSYDPHSADTWLDLGTAYESEGYIDDARNAFLQAKRAYPVSPEVAWRYGNFLLRRGPSELKAAFAEIRHAVEADPIRAAAALALCVRFEPDFNAALDRVLPVSQAAYLNLISALAGQEQTDQALAVWSRLAALHPKLQLSESYPLLEALIHKRQMEEAQRVWGQALLFAGVSRPPDPPGSLVWDGGFESNVVGGGFTWRYPAFVGGVVITLDTKEKHSGNRSIRLTFNGLRNVGFSDVCQYVPVQPSTSYHFSAWVLTRSLSTDQGVRFGLQSIGDSGNSTAWTDDVEGTQPWTKVEFPWTSEKDVRELHLCVSRLPSAKFDSKIRGSAWIDDVALVPESAENTRQ